MLVLFRVDVGVSVSLNESATDGPFSVYPTNTTIIGIHLALGRWKLQC